MRFAVVAVLILALAAAGGYVAFGRGEDPLAGIQIPEVATESGRAHHFDVKAFAKGLNRPTWVGGAPGDDALWVLEQPGRVLRMDGARRTVALGLTDRVKLGAE